MGNYVRGHGKEKLDAVKDQGSKMATRRRKRTGKIPIKKSIDNSNKWVLNKQQRGRCSGEANEWLIGSKTWKRKDIQNKGERDACLQENLVGGLTSRQI